jgi:DNA-binding LacI/PurR family transcriptional regulator
VREQRRATILDVAARAGVHPATVSRTLNRPEKVAPGTRKRVEAAVRKLGFVPNRAAQVMKTGRTGNIAVIVPDITNPHFASMVRAVERAARDADLQVLLADTSEHPARRSAPPGRSRPMSTASSSSRHGGSIARSTPSGRGRPSS